MLCFSSVWTQPLTGLFAEPWIFPSESPNSIFTSWWLIWWLGKSSLHCQITDETALFPPCCFFVRHSLRTLARILWDRLIREENIHLDKGSLYTAYIPNGLLAIEEISYLISLTFHSSFGGEGLILILRNYCLGNRSLTQNATKHVFALP